MSFDWRVADMLGFLRSWSACKRYETQVGSDPVEVAIKVSRPNTLLE